MPSASAAFAIVSQQATKMSVLSSLLYTFLPVEQINFDVKLLPFSYNIHEFCQPFLFALLNTMT